VCRASSRVRDRDPGRGAKGAKLKHLAFGRSVEVANSPTFPKFGSRYIEPQIFHICVVSPEGGIMCIVFPLQRCRCVMMMMLMMLLVMNDIYRKIRIVASPTGSI